MKQLRCQIISIAFAIFFTHVCLANEDNSIASSTINSSNFKFVAILNKDFGALNKNQNESAEATFSRFQNAAELGDTKAQLILASMYARGDGAPLDIKMSVSYIQKAAELMDPDALNLLAVIYANGEVLPKDTGKAFGLFRQAAEQGNVSAQIVMGSLFFRGKNANSAEALKWFTKAVDHADAADTPDIQSIIGMIYYQDENFNQAAGWFKKAAANGNANAQGMLGVLLTQGQGIPKDEIAAAFWTKKAASQGNATAQSELGIMYFNGRGVLKDNVRAYTWLNLAAAQNYKFAQQKRNIIESILTPEQRAEGQHLASNWRKGDTFDSISPSDATNGTSLTKISTGTAFIISKDGKAITNDHVTHDCTEIKIAGRDSVAKVVSSDSVNDLALLQISGKINYVANLNSNVGKLRQGEDVLVFGYPLGTILSSGGNLTPGMVSALSGLGNNTNQIQITAPIQPGSSGSPVIDKNGNVVAVVSMKLNDGAVAHYTGSIPQNVSFAINEQTLKTFLDTNKVQYKMGSKSAKEKHNADIADEASKWTMMVECWK